MNFRLQEEVKLLLIFRYKYHHHRHHKHLHHYHSTTISLFLKLFTFSRLSRHHYPFYVCFIRFFTVEYPKRPVIVQVLLSISRQQFQEFRFSGLCSEPEVNRKIERPGKESNIAVLLALIIVLNSFQFGARVA
jgi:hypothetical protein